MNWVDYREKLGIGFEDDKKLPMCKNRIKNLLHDLDQFYTKENLLEYLNKVGEDYEDFSYLGSSPLVYAYGIVSQSKTIKEFVSQYVALVNSARKTSVTVEGDRFLSELLESCLVGTLKEYRISYEIIRDKDGVFVFPKGIPEFDNSLVSETFLWLQQYPESEKAWGKALRAYSNNDDPSDVADLFRKALERFFQNFFHSDKSLENLKPEYGKFLADHDVPGIIAANLEGTLQQYITYMNNYAKHHDRATDMVLEYIMYQTGNIMRLLMKLSEKDIRDT